MAFDNTVSIVGNLTRDPELRFTNSGQAIGTFGVAVNRRWTNQQTNQQQEETSFFNITAWGSLGENASESLSKGTRVVVTGRLQQRSWETDNGEKRSVVEIVADEISPSLRWATCEVSKNERREGGGGGGGGSPAGGSAGGSPDSAGGYDPGEEPF